MNIVAIDPGTNESGWVLFRHGKVIASGIDTNQAVVAMVHGNEWGADTLAIEMVASYGMAVGKEVFRTVWWSGRFAQAWLQSPSTQGDPVEVYRQEVKLHLCRNPKAKDANIRQALLDLLGPQGTKKAPGPTYGIRSHEWAALAVAVTVAGLTPESMRNAA